MGDITANFSFSEFKPNGETASWKPAFSVQSLMIVELAKNLQIVRNNNGNKPLSINSAVRTASDYSRLLNSGYHPSPVSDHFFGNVVTISKDSPKYKIFGPYYYFSVGAADIHSDNAEELFKTGIALSKSGAVSFGQIIWERDSAKRTEWVHFSNDRSKFYSQIICALVGKEKYLYTTDGGISYKPYV